MRRPKGPRGPSAGVISAEVPDLQSSPRNSHRPAKFLQCFFGVIACRDRLPTAVGPSA
jgi:hypothetical protein